MTPTKAKRAADFDDALPQNCWSSGSVEDLLHFADPDPPCLEPELWKAEAGQPLLRSPSPTDDTNEKVRPLLPSGA